MKVLYTSNTYIHLYLCHIPYLKWFNDNGFIVHTATSSNKELEYASKCYSVPIKRNPFKLDNIKSIFILKKIIETEKYDIIHTNTPSAAVVTRLAALHYRKKNNIKVIYTAHGFHFFKGCPWINWILFFPIEKILSKYTDLIITMNEEDYNFAKKHFKTKIKYIPGIGFKEEKFAKSISTSKRKKIIRELGFKDSDYIISYVAEISNRKRQMYLVKAFYEMNITNEKLLLIGNNARDKRIRKFIKKKGLEDKIKLLGFKDNINEYVDISNLIISVSKQEGLPLNIMEAMYKNKPIIVTNCRGNRDLIYNGVNGLVVDIKDKKSLIEAIRTLKNNKSYALELGRKNSDIINKYSIMNVLKIMDKIYREEIEELYERKD